jgi:hypothetical protein
MKTNEITKLIQQWRQWLTEHKGTMAIVPCPSQQQIAEALRDLYYSPKLPHELRSVCKELKDEVKESIPQQSRLCLVDHEPLVLKHIENFIELLKGTIKPKQELDLDQYYTVRYLADYYSVDYGALRKALERLRGRNSDCYHENVTPKVREAKYTYQAREAETIAKKMRKKCPPTVR